MAIAIGLGAGAGTGAIIGAASIHDGSGFAFISRAAAIGILAAAGAIVGTVVGIAIPTGGWRDVYKK